MLRLVSWLLLRRYAAYFAARAAGPAPPESAVRAEACQRVESLTGAATTRRIRSLKTGDAIAAAPHRHPRFAAAQFVEIPMEIEST